MRAVSDDLLLNVAEVSAALIGLLLVGVSFFGFEGRSDHAAIGAVTNLAARLADEATSGQILIEQRLLPRSRTTSTWSPSAR